MLGSGFGCFSRRPLDSTLAGMLQDDERLSYAPEPTPGETAEEAIKTVTVALAGPGAPLAVQLWEAVSPGYKARLHDWFDDVAEAINELKDKSEEFRPERLAKNDMFQTALWTAAQAAIRNHQKEKHEYLRNAVLNSVKSGGLAESIQLIFLQLVDRLTVLHVKVLAELNTTGPWVWTPSEEAEPMVPFEEIMGRFSGELDRGLFRAIVSDLDAAQLVKRFSDGQVGGMRVSHERGTTDLGRAFVEYVTQRPF